jgi:hypothetical protein
MAIITGIWTGTRRRSSAIKVKAKRLYRFDVSGINFTWKGEGNFFNISLNASIGSVPFEITIDKENIVTGKVGDARLTKTTIRKAGYGFEIRGILDTKLKKDHDLDRKHLIILLVMPEENRDSVRYSDANFHLKNNYFFDFAMRVGGVELRKEP